MKLKKPVISICIIVIIVVDLIFFSFLCIGKKTKDKEFVNEIVSKFNVKKYILDNDNIKHSINNYKYNEKVFDYLDKLKIQVVKKNFVNTLFNKEEPLIEKEAIIEILNNSVYEYEYNTSEDIYSYVSEDIKIFANYFTNKFDHDFIKSYYDFSNFTNGIVYYISLILLTGLFVLLIIIEKKNGFLISSITLLLYSFFLYYFNNHFLDTGFSSILKYFDNISLHLENIYVICFIFGFVLLLIYIVYYLKKVARNIRLNSYYRR